MSGLATVWFGMLRTLPCALTARFVLGLSNGMHGTFKTLAFELARGDAELETRGMGAVFGMWGVGFLLSPAVSGWLAEPVQQYSAAALVRWGLWNPVLLWKRKRMRSHLIAYWLYSFVIICIDEAFPLFCMSKSGGLGISEAVIGKVLSASGLVL